MIVQFSVENFRSFKDKSILSFQAGSIKEHASNVYASPLQPDFKVLKSCGLFGPNNSGKTNLIKALIFCQKLIVKNFESNVLSDTQHFKLTEGYEKKNSSFEFIVIANGNRYKYGFSLLLGKVVNEYLFSVLKTKEELIYMRSEVGFSYGKKIRQDLRQTLDLLNGVTRGDTLFLSVLSKFNYPVAMELINWFQNMIFYDDAQLEDWVNMTATLMGEDDYYFIRVQKFISKLKLGINSVEQRAKEQSQKSKFSEGFLGLIYKSNYLRHNVFTLHNKFSQDKVVVGKVKFDLMQDESIGTQKIFALLGPILYALRNQTLVIIDEIDSKLHTDILESIISAFHADGLNIVGSQLIFTSHNPTPLKMDLRRDQIILFEKDEIGSSSFESLHKKKPEVRNDASFDKDYLQGKYSSIPKLGNQLDLFSEF